MHAAAIALATVAALRVPGPLSPRNASYRIDAVLDAPAHTVTGRGTLSWRNVASGPARELVFHLYMNAFKNEASTFFRESRGRHRTARSDARGWGYIEVTRLAVRGQDLTGRLKVDDTLGTVALDAPVEPGETVEIALEWRTVLPKVFARTGYHEDFFAVAQWFPKIAVFDCEGGCRFRAHQHHLNSEFFADYGVYDVTFDVPAAHEVGGTGVVVSDTRTGDRRRLAFHAEDVHDFALVSSPRLRAHAASHRDALGELSIVHLAIAGREANVPRHLAAARATLDLLGRRLGPYPYAQLTIVDVPRGAEGAGGMEYPTLFFTFDPPVPGRVRAPELVTAHELAHQYFQGLVASDEVEEAWLDEGLTETMTDFVLEDLFGPTRNLYDLAGHHLSVLESNRLRYRTHADRDPLTVRAFDYVDNATYGAITYAKTNVALRTLERLIGEGPFWSGLQRYYAEWAFRHPRRADFVKSFEAGAGRDLGWFFGPVLDTTQTLDYQVLDVRTRKNPAPAGLFSTDGGVREVTPPKDRDAPYTSEVVVHRKGELVLPVELEVRFADGRTVTERWDGQDGRWRRYTYDGQVTWAQLKSLPLDVSRLNDGRRAEGDPRPRRVVTSWLEDAVSLLSSLVGF